MKAEDWFRLSLMVGNETSVRSSDVGDFDQLQQEEEHAGNRCE